MTRIYFEKYDSEKDFSDYYKLLSNKEVMDMNYGRPFTMEEAGMVFNKLLKINKQHEKFGYFKIFERDRNKLIGLAGIIIKENSTEADVEYLLFPEYWGKGYGTEVLEELLSISREDKNIKKIIGITDPNNIASRKILLKQGFISEKVYEIEDGSLAERFINTL